MFGDSVYIQSPVLPNTAADFQVLNMFFPGFIFDSLYRHFPIAAVLLLGGD